MAMLAGFFGILAVVLAAIGLYGIIAYTVAQRTSEIGIRMALGAGAVRIFRLVLADVAGTLGVGIMAGIALTVGVAPIAQSLGYDVTIVDPRTAFASPERFPDVPLIAEWPDVALPPSPSSRWLPCSRVCCPRCGLPGSIPSKRWRIVSALESTQSRES